MKIQICALARRVAMLFEAYQGLYGGVPPIIVLSARDVWLPLYNP